MWAEPGNYLGSRCSDLRTELCELGIPDINRFMVNTASAPASSTRSLQNCGTLPGNLVVFSVKEDVADATEDAAEKAEDLKEGAAEKAAEVKEAASDAATQAKEAASQAAESAKHAIKDSTEK